MNREREVKFSNSIFASDNIAKFVAVFALLALFSLYFQNAWAVVAICVLMIGVLVGNRYERRD